MNRPTVVDRGEGLRLENKAPLRLRTENTSTYTFLFVLSSLLSRLGPAFAFPFLLTVSQYPCSFELIQSTESNSAHKRHWNRKCKNNLIQLTKTHTLPALFLRCRPSILSKPTFSLHDSNELFFLLPNLPITLMWRRSSFSNAKEGILLSVYNTVRSSLLFHSNQYARLNFLALHCLRTLSFCFLHPVLIFFIALSSLVGLTLFLFSFLHAKPPSNAPLD